MAEGLIDGTAFAVDASLIAADANKQRSAVGTKDHDWDALARTRRSVREYLDTLDDECEGHMIGTAKRLVAEILGDGALAEEGTRQSHGATPRPEPYDDATTALFDPRLPAVSMVTASSATALTDRDRFAMLLGHAALNVLPDLSRDAQERLFAAAVDDGIIANALAVFLHDRHPRTAHPSKRTQIA